MQLYKIHGGTKEELENRQYTIGVGLSLGNKWFTPENIIELIKWALFYSKDKVVVYVADSIHAINIQVRSKRSASSAMKLALEAGEELFKKVKEQIKVFPAQDLERLIFVKWNELIDEKFSEKLTYLRSVYRVPGPFQDKIHSIVRNHISNEKRKFSEEDIHMLGSYIIEEFPELINRVSMGEIIVDAYVYPQDGELVELVEQIQKGEFFPEIREAIMDTEPKVFLGVR